MVEPAPDEMAGLPKDYGDRARCIHIEVWKDYQGKQFNDAANEWIARGEDVNDIGDAGRKAMSSISMSTVRDGALFWSFPPPQAVANKVTSATAMTASRASPSRRGG